MGRTLAAAPQLKISRVPTGGNDLKDFIGPCIVVSCEIQQLPKLCRDFVNFVTNHANNNQEIDVLGLIH